MEFRLRPWQPADAQSAADNVSSNVSKFMSDAFPTTKEGWQTFIGSLDQNPRMFCRAIEINDLAVGGIGILLQDDIMRRNAELGYWLGDAYRGHGIVTQAVGEIVKLAFDTFDIDRIYATPFGTNFASHRVLEKAGFRLEAMFEKVVVKNGIMLDELVYAIRRNNE